MKKNDPYDSPLTHDEKIFAAEHLKLVYKFLCTKKLPYDDWFDVVIFRYLRSVKRWFAIPELHKYDFSTIAFQNMASSLHHEYEMQSRRIKTVSLSEMVPGSEDLTYYDMITYDDLNLIIRESTSDDKYSPGKSMCRENKIIRAFLDTDRKYIRFRYSTSEKAMNKYRTIKRYKKQNQYDNAYEVHKKSNTITIVRI